MQHTENGCGNKKKQKIIRNKFVTYRHINSHRKLLSTLIPVGTTMLHGLRCSIYPSPSARYQSFLLSCEVVCMSLTAELEPANKIQSHVILCKSLVKSCMLGIFSCFCCRLLTFCEISSFRNTIRVSNSLNPGSNLLT